MLTDRLEVVVVVVVGAVAVDVVSFIGSWLRRSKDAAEIPFSCDAQTRFVRGSAQTLTFVVVVPPRAKTQMGIKTRPKARSKERLDGIP